MSEKIRSLDSEKLNSLKNVVSNLSIEEMGIAGGLFSQHQRLGGLTAKQWGLCDDLIGRGDGSAPAESSSKLVAKLKVDKLFGLLESLGVEYPKVRVMADGEIVCIKRYGSRSKYHGSLNVGRDGAEFKDYTAFYGLIHPDGTFEESRQGCSPALLKVIRSLCANPEKVMRDHIAKISASVAE